MLAKSVIKRITGNPPPRIIGSCGTQPKFVCSILTSLCAKFGAFFQSVTIFSLNHLTISRNLGEGRMGCTDQPTELIQTFCKVKILTMSKPWVSKVSEHYAGKQLFYGTNPLSDSQLSKLHYN